MKLLCIDASGKSAACAVYQDGKTVAESFINSGLTHSQTLLPLVDKMLTDAKITIDDIDTFAVTNGPGSFTGLRIGMALVMGLAGERNCIGVPTLDALAYNLIDRDGIIIPVMDARRNQVYTALYRCKDGVITKLYEDSAISVEEVLQRAMEFNGEKIWILGDGAYLFENKSDIISFPENEKLFPTGTGIALASKNFKAVSPRELKINYLRLSQAERELKERQKNGN